MEQAWDLHEVCRQYLSLTMSISLTLSTSSNSTLGPNCVPNAQQAAIYYFNSTVSLFQKLPTYTWLAGGGITPSSTNTYTREAIVNVLRSAYGFEVGLDCNSDRLSQVNYYYNVSVDPAHGLLCPFH